MERNDKDLQELRDLLQKAEATRPPPPSPSPTVEEISNLMLSMVLPELHASVSQSLGAISQGVTNSLQTQQEDICRMVFERVFPLIKVVESSKEFAESLVPDPARMPPPVFPISAALRTAQY